MNLLFVLRGLPGAGKSTFIREQGFKPYTIEPDKIRLLFGGIVHGNDGEWTIPQSYDTDVWNFIDKILINRLDKGITTFIDATSIPLKSLNHYKSLCEKYNTKMYVVDFTNVPLEVIRSRNNQRDYKKVSDSVINRMFENLQMNNDLSGFNVIEPKQVNKIIFQDYMKSFEVNANKYKKIIVFGDIHGCHTILHKAMSEYKFSDDNLYVFTGDYFDRGIENREVLEFCLSNCKKKNFIFLMGNHELHIKHYVMACIVDTPAFEKTLEEFGSLEKQLFKFYKSLKPLAIIKYGNFTYNITHGGIPSYPTPMTPTIEYVKGVGKYQDSEDVDNAYSNRYNYNEFSIHGHRNIKNVPIHNTEKTYNLEGQIELGGFLRYLEINKKGIKEKMLQNNVYDEALKNKHCKSNSAVEALDKSELIRKKDLGDGIVSYNFTRDAFYKSAWNDQTITARGLFLDKDTGKVIARSYNKFFAIEERPETEWRNLKNKLQFPVKAYLKENGFLGIVSYNPKTDDLFIASKSTNQGEFAENLKRILLKQIGVKSSYLKEVLKTTNCSAIFECIDPINDPHIIPYQNEKVVLLDVVKNDFSNTFMNYTFVKDLANELGVKCKELCMTFDNFEELKSRIDTLESDGYMSMSQFEGYVFVDKNRYMLKYKTPFYRFWKTMRRIKGNLALGKEIKDNLNDYQEKIADFMRFHYTSEELNTKSIIEIRKDYLQKVEKEK